MTKQFVRDSLYEDLLANSNFDASTKLIYSDWSSGTDYGMDTYQLIEGKPVLIEQVIVQPEESQTEYYTRISQKLINGQMKIVKTERLTEEQYQNKE